MKAVIIGSGNVAWALAQAFAASEHELCAVVSRNSLRGNQLSALCGCRWSALTNPLPQADLYIIAVSDRAVAEVARSLNFAPQSVVAHTAGSLRTDILEGVAHQAAFYPFQTFTAGIKVDMDEVPILVEGSDSLAKEVIEKAALSLSSHVIEADYEKRTVVHLSGVFVSNFVNSLYGIAGRIVDGAAVDFDILKPLIAQTARKALLTDDPAKVQTGPAVRGDKAVMQHHLSMLEANERWSKIYRLISDEIWETSKKT